MNLLTAGKALYIEGGDFGYSNSTTQLYAMFGCTYQGDGSDSATGNVNTLTGQSGSIANGKTYNYLYQRSPDNYIDYVGANGGVLFFKSQDNLGRAVSYGGTGNTYRAIHSAFVFGALRNGANTKNQLMTTYMQYLLRTNIEEASADGLVSGCSVMPNPCRGKTTIDFVLSRPSYVTATIYNISGQVVRNLTSRRLTNGRHRITWGGADNSGRALSDGSYFLTLKADGKVVTRTIVLAQ